MGIRDPLSLEIWCRSGFYHENWLLKSNIPRIFILSQKIIKASNKHGFQNGIGDKIAKTEFLFFANEMNLVYLPILNYIYCYHLNKFFSPETINLLIINNCVLKN